MSEIHDSHFINGQCREAHSNRHIDVINPATETVIGRIVDGDETDVDNAVRAAERAGPAWAALHPAERVGAVRRLARLLEDRTEEIAQLVTSQNGTPITISRAVQASVPAYYRYFAQLGDSFEVETELSVPTGRAIVRREPVGVVAAIVPWNGPQSTVAWKIGPALIAGCTVVVKPSPETSLDAFILAELVSAAGFPPGVVNIVTGGRETGAALVSHPAVRKVAFTGSSAAGKSIAAQCARDLKRYTLELGGKSAAILLDDVDLDHFRGHIAAACVPNTGQTCRALTRILAPRARYEEVVQTVVEAVTSMPLGNPADPRSFFGPLTSASQKEKVESYIELGKSEGASVALGGRLTPKGNGYYVDPTVFRDATNEMRIAREEIFGPVLVVIPYESDEDAVRIANDSDFGLSGGIFSQNSIRAAKIARRIETGMVAVNASGYMPPQAPFGGVKSSGVGRELGASSLDAYIEIKTIYGTL